MATYGVTPAGTGCCGVYLGQPLSVPPIVTEVALPRGVFEASKNAYSPEKEKEVALHSDDLPQPGKGWWPL